MERYRDEKRGPLLDRAGEIFSILTLGSFKTLEIDYDDVDKPQLMGRRPNGRYVDFDGLSEGTRDQLFLSLRLAAVEIQLQHAQPLPFIADEKRLLDQCELSPHWEYVASVHHLDACDRRVATTWHSNVLKER